MRPLRSLDVERSAVAVKDGVATAQRLVLEGPGFASAFAPESDKASPPSQSSWVCPDYRLGHQDIAPSARTSGISDYPQRFQQRYIPFAGLDRNIEGVGDMLRIQSVRSGGSNLYSQQMSVSVKTCPRMTDERLAHS